MSSSSCLTGKWEAPVAKHATAANKRKGEVIKKLIEKVIIIIITIIKSFKTTDLGISEQLLRSLNSSGCILGLLLLLLKEVKSGVSNNCSFRGNGVGVKSSASTSMQSTGVV